MRTRTSRSVALLLACVLPAACGVTAEEEPRPLTTSTVFPAPTPTVTQRPDPTSPTSPPSSTTTAATSPPTATTR
ncbi:MAG: hypothetical protein HOV94_13090 [Saccharothrix sp.]|nr:hypothetical protein [Saccharothrix sp.]